MSLPSAIYKYSAVVYVMGMKLPTWTSLTVIHNVFANSPNTLEIVISNESDQFIWGRAEVFGDVPKIANDSFKQNMKTLKDKIGELIYLGDCVISAQDSIVVFFNDLKDNQKWYWGFKGFVSAVTSEDNQESNSKTIVIRCEGVTKLLRNGRVNVSTGIGGSKVKGVTLESLLGRKAPEAILYTSTLENLSLRDFFKKLIVKNQPGKAVQKEVDTIVTVEDDSSVDPVLVEAIVDEQIDPDPFTISFTERERIIEFEPDDPNEPEQNPLDGVPGFPESVFIDVTPESSDNLPFDFLTLGMDYSITYDNLLPRLLWYLEHTSLTKSQFLSRFSPEMPTKDLIKVAGETLSVFGPKNDALNNLNALDGESVPLGYVYLRLPNFLEEAKAFLPKFKENLSIREWNYLRKSQALDEVLKLNHLLLYETPVGDIIIEPIFYDFTPDDFVEFDLSNKYIVKDFSENLTVDSRDFLFESFTFADTEMRNFIKAHGTYSQFSEAIGREEEAIAKEISPQSISGFAWDDRLLKIYGIKDEEFENLLIYVGTDPKDLQIFASIIMNLLNSDTRSSSFKMMFRPGLPLARPLYDKVHDRHWFIKSITHNVSLAATPTTTLGLGYCRRRISEDEIEHIDPLETERGLDPERATVSPNGILNLWETFRLKKEQQVKEGETK